jgi:NADH-quinone oxidoreductase subunit L
VVDSLPVLLAASGARTASAASVARHGGFNPAALLPWAAPLVLAAPVVGFVVEAVGIRGRRAAGNFGLFVVLVMLAATATVGWVRFHVATAYTVTYDWINIPVAYQGDPRFQEFVVELAMRYDHLALAGLGAVLLILLLALAWHRTARGEQGPIRFQVAAMLLALGATGALLSPDLVAFAGFWVVAGVASYLLLGHRWGTEAAGRRGRIALALPFAGDVALLAAVAVLYSRFGSLEMGGLWPQLHKVPGVGLKSLDAAAVLAVVAVTIRSSIWPFTPWQTAAADAPPSALAAVAGVWPVLAGTLLLRVLPLIGGGGPQPHRIAAYAFGVAAVVGPLASLVATDARRALLLGSSGAVALGLLGILYSPSDQAGFTALLAAATARAGGLLAVGAAVAAMRTVDLRELGGAWVRMRWTALALLLAAVGLAVAGYAPASLRPGSIAWLAFAPALALVALAAFRTYAAAAHGPLRRRRAFEPSRVREAPALAAGGALVSGLAGLVAVLLAFWPGWTGYLQHAAGAAPGHGPWAVVGAGLVVAGAGAALVGLWTAKDAVLGAAAAAGAVQVSLVARVAALAERVAGRTGAGLRALDGPALSGLEGALGRSLAAAGAVPGPRRLPWVPTLLGVAVALAVIFGLLGQGGR